MSQEAHCLHPSSLISEPQRGPCPLLGGWPQRGSTSYPTRIEKPLALLGFLPVSYPQGSQGETRVGEKAELRSGLEPYWPLCVSWNLTQRDLTGGMRLQILRWVLSLHHPGGPKVITAVLVRGHGSRDHRRRVREMLGCGYKGGQQATSQRVQEPLEAGKGRSRFSPGASGRIAGLLGVALSLLTLSLLTLNHGRMWLLTVVGTVLGGSCG